MPRKIHALPLAGARAPRRRGPQHLGAGSALGIRQLVVRLDDQQPAQRDHRREAEQAAEERQCDDLQVRWHRAPQEQRGDREDRAGRERRRGRCDRLRQVRLEDRAPGTEQAEDRHGHHRGRDRGRDRHADAQAEVGIGRPEHDAEHDADDDRLEREFRDVPGLRHPRDDGRGPRSAQCVARAAGISRCRACRRWSDSGPGGMRNPMRRQSRGCWFLVLAALVAASALAAEPMSLSAAYHDGTLVLRTEGSSGPVEAVAHWTVDVVPEGSHGYRVARLDLPDGSTRRRSRAQARTAGDGTQPIRMERGRHAGDDGPRATGGR